MMGIKNYLTLVIRDFVMICTCILIGTAVFLTVFHYEGITASLLWQIVIISFASAAADLIFKFEGWMNKIPLAAKMAVHFILICGISFSGAYFFRWPIFNKTTTLVLYSVLFLMIYILVWVAIEIYDRAQARLLNKKLSEYKNKRGESVE